MDLGLVGASVCVSGGSKGMGRAAALGFAREGARVIVTGRNDDALKATEEALRDAGAPDALGVRCVLPEPAEIENLFRVIADRWGELNTLVNMAGPTDDHSAPDFAGYSDESWDYFFQMGIMSVVRCCREAVPLMRKAGWGRIVNISSQSARIANPTECAYMTVKAGLTALSKNMAWGLAKENILVNSLTPGGVYTELMAERMQSTGVAPDGVGHGDLVGVADWLAGYAGARSCGIIGRVATAEEIAPHIVLLGSKANTFVVGTNVAVDGGTDYSTG